MEQEAKKSLETLIVQSFTTSLSEEEQKELRGGDGNSNGTTSMPVFC